MAAEKRLTAVSRPSGLNRALLDGSVRPPGYELDWQDVPVLVQAFRRMVRGNEFDVCEMAATTYLAAKAYRKPFTALPVFLVRGFHHGAILRAAGGPVEHPEQLEGRRVGVNRGYTVTTGVWARAVLQEEYGVDLSRITWVPTGDEHVAEFEPPPNVAPAPPGSSLPEMVASGDLAAVVGLTAADGLVPLIDDPEAAALASFRRTGVLPINHLVVVRDELLAADPALAPALFDAFAEAKKLNGDDTPAYGIEPNRHVLTALLRHALDQRILAAPPVLEELFAAGTWDLVG
jgi:4,5-dihydroxyphthalate decarboxylase